jgi:hypothetical protein
MNYRIDKQNKKQKLWKEAKLYAEIRTRYVRINGVGTERGNS